VFDGIRLMRLAGFPVAINWSVLVILWLFTWSLASYSLPAASPGRSAAAYWLAGFAGALLLLGSLLAHELAHALAARRVGVEVKRLTLWVFGGVASLGGEARSARADFFIAAIGPATSLALALVFAAAAEGLDVVGAPRLVAGVAWWLAGTNLVLGLFNLLPGAPLDGGRVLRAWLWHRYQDRARASIAASRAGQVLAFVIVSLGLLELFTGTTIGGLWMVFIGWFLLSAARVEEIHVTTRSLLSDVLVRDAMTTDPKTGPSWLTIEASIQQYVLGARHSAYPVVSFDGGVQGLITLAQLREVPPEQRLSTRVADVALPMAEVPIAGPDEPLVNVLGRSVPATGGRVLVLDDEGRLVGILTPADVTRALEVRAVARPLAGRSGEV
jgi:Zn-dependent protease